MTTDNIQILGTDGHRIYFGDALEALSLIPDGSVDLMGTMENLRSTLGELDQTTQAQALATIFGKILCHLMQKCVLNNRAKSVKTKFINVFLPKSML